MNTQVQSPQSISVQMEQMEYLIAQMEQSGISGETLEQLKATLQKLREESNAKRIYVLYHANCTDGSLAAYLFLAAFEGCGIPIRFIPCQYQSQDLNEAISRISKEVTEQDEVYIVDFSLPLEKHKELVESRACRVVTLDHHESASKVYEDLHHLWLDPERELFEQRVLTVIDQTKCGSMLVLDYLTMHPIYSTLPNVLAINSNPQFLKLMELVDVTDRYQKDRWTPETLPVLSVATTIGVREQFSLWTQVLQSTWEDKVKIGQFLQAKNDKIIDSLVAMAHPIVISSAYTDENGKDYSGRDDVYLGVECPYEFVSAVGHRIAELSRDNPLFLSKKLANHEESDDRLNFGVAVLVTPGNDDTVKLSFRSIDCENGTTAIKAAERVGGGGHVHAAGAVVKVDQVASLM